MSLNPLISSTPALAMAAADADPVAAAASADDARFRAKAQAAAEKFESFFIADMLKQMRSATRELADDDSVYKDRVNEDMLEMADGKLADALAGQRAFGIADAILRQLLPAPTGPAGAAGAATAPIPFKRGA
jgi:flagellar protein FlgJ